jgi:hypothetical protein
MYMFVHVYAYIYIYVYTYIYIYIYMYMFISGSQTRKILEEYDSTMSLKLLEEAEFMEKVYG